MYLMKNQYKATPNFCFIFLFICTLRHTEKHTKLLERRQLAELLELETISSHIVQQARPSQPQCGSLSVSLHMGHVKWKQTSLGLVGLACETSKQ